jgi:hypothetical protein
MRHTKLRFHLGVMHSISSHVSCATPVHGIVHPSFYACSWRSGLRVALTWLVYG